MLINENFLMKKEEELNTTYEEMNRLKFKLNKQKQQIRANKELLCSYNIYFDKERIQTFDKDLYLKIKTEKYNYIIQKQVKMTEKKKKLEKEYLKSFKKCMDLNNQYQNYTTKYNNQKILKEKDNSEELNVVI